MASRGDIKSEHIQPVLDDGWETINFLASLKETGSYVKLKSREYLKTGKYPVIDQGEAPIAGYVEDVSLTYKGELPVVIFGDHTRNIKYVDRPFAVGADGVKILSPGEMLDARFFYYYLRALNVPSLGYSRHFNLLYNLQVPVPSLAEQKRIATRLDELFQHLALLTERCVKSSALQKTFRERVLTMAITGALTEDWRTGQENIDSADALPDRAQKKRGQQLSLFKNGKPQKAPAPVTAAEATIAIPEEWMWTRVGGIARLINGDRGKSYPHVSEYVAEGIPFINAGHIESNGSLSTKKMNFISREKFNTLNGGKTIKGDLIYCLRGTLGKTAMVEYEEGAIASSLVIIRAEKEVLNEYLYYFLISPFGRELIRRYDNGTAQPNLSANSVSEYPFPLPPFKEQQAIVAKVKALFAHVGNIEAHYNSVDNKIAQLPRRFLEKAFKGELIPRKSKGAPKPK